MTKIKTLITALFLMTAYFSNAQSNETKAISAEQKSYLTTTWYESPKESDGNTLVYRLTEYKMIVGQDFFKAPPGKITFAPTGNFNGENIKVGKTADVADGNSGKWNITGNDLTLDFSGKKNKMTVVSIEKDKLVLKAE